MGQCSLLAPVLAPALKRQTTRVGVLVGGSGSGSGSRLVLVVVGLSRRRCRRHVVIGTVVAEVGGGATYSTRKGRSVHPLETASDRNCIR